MQYLVNNKIYDTEKAEKIMVYKKTIPHKTFFDVTVYPRYRHTLYKTAKGQFFVHIGEYVKDSSIIYNDKDYIELLSENEVKELLNKTNQVAVYNRLFNDLQEG